jgi:protein O-mannosyl-transferase
MPTQPPTVPSPTKPWPHRLALALCALAACALYLSASWNNAFVYDDHEVIQDQFPLHDLKDIAEIFAEPHYLNFPYYRPITRLTFAIQKNLSGDSPRPYHLFNAILAGAIVLAAYLLLRRPCFLLGPWPALLAATWFGLHPAISECVYPAASGRETLLPALFILLTMWAYLREGCAWSIATILFFAVSLFCKEQAAVLPLLFVISDVLKLSPAKPSQRVVQYVLIVLIAAIYLIIRHHVLTGHPLHGTLLEHPFEPLKSLLYGIQTAVAPFMALHYEPAFDDWFNPALLAVSLLAFAAVWTLAFWNSTPDMKRAALFWSAWFILLQLPTAHLIRQDADYSERYVALSILAFPALLAAVWQQRLAGRLRLGVASGALAWTALLAVVSFLRGSFYFSDLTFSRQWAATSPEATGPYKGLGLVAQQQHQWPTAIQAYEHVLKLDPSDATAHNNLANLLADEGDNAGAAQHYEWLLTHDTPGADRAAILTNYAQLLGAEAAQTHDPHPRDRALQMLEEAIALRPGYAQAHYILGVWDQAFSTQEAAIEQFRIALRLKPEFTEVQKRLENLEAATKPATQISPEQ